MISERLKLMKGSKKIVGTILHPSRKKQHPLIIVCHGFLSSKLDVMPFALSLCKHGYDTCVFDFSGHGESSGSISDISIKEQVKDLDLVVKKTNNKNTSIFAFSLGCIASTIYCSKNKKIKSLALLNPVIDFEEAMKSTLNKDSLDKWEKRGYEIFRNFLKIRKFKINDNFLHEGRKIKLNNAAKKIKCPTLIMQSEHDRKASIKECKKFYNNLTYEKEFYLIRKGQHEITNLKHLREINNKTAEWFKKTLI